MSNCVAVDPSRADMTPTWPLKGEVSTVELEHTTDIDPHIAMRHNVCHERRIAMFASRILVNTGTFSNRPLRAWRRRYMATF